MGVGCLVVFSWFCDVILNLWVLFRFLLFDVVYVINWFTG